MKRIIFVMFLLAGVQSVNGQTPFSEDSSAAYLRSISVDIGPRPMGSPNERRAMDFALGKFRQFGLSDAYLMPISEYPSSLGGGPTNTRSGVAVGVLRGATDRIIVLGAHIDSADPDVPGANDDGSGTAVILELARVLSQRKNESTIVFALFGGEEAGLKGSRYFVDHFPDLSRVALMLQVDMANGTPLLFPTLDAGRRSAPEWLVRASYEEFAKLGYRGLHFPTDFFVFMGSLPGGGVGSDHEPFLEKDIPAIDFTSDARDPIHTPQDNFDNFKKGGLKRSGDLIYKLTERFDAGVPEEKTGTYFLYQAGSYPFFVPLWLLSAFIIVSIGVASYALVRVRTRRERYEGVQRPTIPGLKLFLLMLLIQVCVWLSENIVAMIKGVRYPWMSDITGYFVLAFFAGCVGIWLSLRLSPRLNLRHDAYTYYLRAFIFLLLFVAAASLSSVKLALYPATALFLLGLAMLVQHPILKLLFWILSPHFMFRIFFTEAFDFLARFMHSQPEITPVINGAFTAICVLFFSLWSFPFLLGFAAVAFDLKSGPIWLKVLRRPGAGTAVAALFVITLVVLVRQDSYSREWKPLVRIEESYNLDSTRGTLAVRSSEYLSGTRVKFLDRDTLVPSSTEIVFEKALPAPAAPWLHLERSFQLRQLDSSVRVDLVVHADIMHRPYRLKLGYSAIKGRLTEPGSPYALGTAANSVTLQWGAFSDTTLTIPISFSMTAADTLTLREHVEGVFVELPEPVTVIPRMDATVVRRTSIVRDAIVKLR